MALLDRFRKGLARTRALLSRHAPDAHEHEELEEALVLADVGARLAHELAARAARAPDPWQALAEEAARILRAPAPVVWPEDGPLVALICGANGVGKTTTIGKLAWRWGKEGKKVLVVAADTFRAAAREQLAAWCERAGALFFAGSEGADPAAVAFDGVQHARARGVDAVIVDTAGRTHAHEGLVRELAKVRRAIGKALAGAPHASWVVVDAASGQNAIVQVKTFAEAAGTTGVILTKLDGSAKGGIALALAHETGLPIQFLGVGESLEDLVEFTPDAFARALFADRSTGIASEGKA